MEALIEKGVKQFMDIMTYLAGAGGGFQPANDKLHNGQWKG